MTVGAECRGPQIAIVDLRLIGDPELGALDLRVAMAVAACLDGKTREGQTTVDVLVALTGSTRTKVSAAISKLERQGHMTVVRRRGVGGRYYANRYRMPVNEGMSAYVPLGWAFHPAMTRDMAALKALIFCAKLASADGWFLFNPLIPRHHPQDRITQCAAAIGADIRTAWRGWKKLIQMGALNGGLAPLMATNDGEVAVDWDAVNLSRLTYDPNELDLAGNLLVMHLSRPGHVWPAASQRAHSAKLGCMAGILGVHGEPSRGTRRTTSGDMANHLGGHGGPPRGTESAQVSQPRFIIPRDISHRASAQRLRPQNCTKSRAAAEHARIIAP